MAVLEAAVAAAVAWGVSAAVLAALGLAAACNTPSKHLQDRKIPISDVECQGHG